MTISERPTYREAFSYANAKRSRKAKSAPPMNARAVMIANIGMGEIDDEPLDNIPSFCYKFLVLLSEGRLRRHARGGAGCGACGRGL